MSNRRADAEDARAQLAERVRARLRPVAADDHERIDAVPLERRDRAAASFELVHLRAARAPEHGPAEVDDPADVAIAEDDDVVAQEPGEAVAEAVDLPAAISAVRATARIAAFMPGASPPLVSTPMRLTRAIAGSSERDAARGSARR